MATVLVAGEWFNGCGHWHVPRHTEPWTLSCWVCGQPQ